MRDCSGKCGEGHDKDACSNGCFEFVSQNRSQDQKHHHTAAGTDEAAYKSNDDTTDNGLYGTFLSGYALHRFLGSHNRSHNEFDTQQESHKDGEIPHGGRWYETGYITAHNSENQYGSHHDQAVFDIQILVLAVSISGNGAGQYIG